MKTQTALEFLKEKLKIINGSSYKPPTISFVHCASLLKDYSKHHTTTQIEALRERLIEKGIKKYGFEITENEIDQTINEFLKEIND